MNIADQKCYRLSNKIGFSWILATIVGITVMSFVYGYVRFKASYVYYTLIASIAFPAIVCYAYSFSGALMVG
ncbi:hypothetical protein [Candidatus Uabimicrobium sp. HlEnr_7]|uniref:hypothetical protein n=1 Tax=Candidatus Uabimicrobium helgolandensis TaxID=3095367 RepID=UPI003557DCDD